MLHCSIWFPMTATNTDPLSVSPETPPVISSRMPPSSAQQGPMEGGGSDYFRSFNSSFAASSDEAGFWPVTSLPSTTT
ncbi:hypothetical protein LCGC14_0247180 [marine sediment metagenome]|uniref:Uncharacterized protein n=1 Tax=marine sediment metagenome TaxID=412755 RepID=A0A0F9UM80_9ZZZZ